MRANEARAIVLFKAEGDGQVDRLWLLWSMMHVRANLHRRVLMLDYHFVVGWGPGLGSASAVNRRTWMVR